MTNTTQTADTAPQPPRFCVSCQHCKRAASDTVPAMWACTAPQGLITDPVTGGQAMMLGGFCGMLRSGVSGCGSEGRWWAPYEGGK